MSSIKPSQGRNLTWQVNVVLSHNSKSQRWAKFSNIVTLQTLKKTSSLPVISTKGWKSIWGMTLDQQTLSWETGQSERSQSLFTSSSPPKNKPKSRCILCWLWMTNLDSQWVSNPSTYKLNKRKYRNQRANPRKKMDSCWKFKTKLNTKSSWWGASSR